ncbi:MAG: TIGR00282 family metallophosphoesterase [Thermoguttaceae bacterium]|nr:TIGR00282 family metallophosphoesterase [Thermoguttaceae bacterium]
MRILMIGDIVGKPGRQVIQDELKNFRELRSIDFVIANAENSAGGSGLTIENYQTLIRSGVDCITLGDHAYRQQEIYPVLEAEANIVRPGNFPINAPGKRLTVLPVPQSRQKYGMELKIVVMALLGQTFMKPIDSPLHAIDDMLAEIPRDVRIRVLDYHAEATSDKQVMGRYLDGRVSAVLGTHTHVATADETIFPKGTAFQCDVGMTGPFESIIGRRIDRVTETLRTFRPTPYDVAKDDVRINGTLVDIDHASGKALSIERVVVRASKK